MTETRAIVYALFAVTMAIGYASMPYGSIGRIPFAIVTVSWMIIAINALKKKG